MSNGKTGKQIPLAVRKMKNPRMAKTLKLVIESGGKKSVSKAMLESGYAKATTINPQKITSSKTWNQLLEEYLPDDELLTVHNQAIHATKLATSLTEPDKIVDDIPTRLRAVDLAYKVKNRFPAEKLDVNERIELVKIIKYGEPKKT